MTERTLRILQLSPRLPYPLMDGGVISVYRLAESTAKLGEQITFVTYPDRDPALNAEARSAIEPIMRLELVSKPMPSRKAMLLRTMFRGAYPIERRMMPEMYALIEKLIEEQQYDIVHIDHAHMGKYGLWIKERFGLPVILREHNYETLIYQRYAKNERNPFKKFVARMHGRRLKKEEFRFIRGLDATSPITPEDEALMRIGVPDAWYETVPAGVDDEYFSPRSAQEDPATIMWVGGMNWAPNKDAVYYFAREVFPLVRKRYPNARFEVVGVKTETLEDLKKELGDAIALHGRVDDIRPYVERATVMICPLRVGGGMRLKLLDFFAMGKAVVSTSIGAEGNIACNDMHILIRDTPQDFAEGLMRLIDSPQERKRLGAHARQLVENEYSWESVGRRFIELYRKVIERHRGNN
jgi:polysaccharide biosynthesis protein PslH